MSKRSPFDSSTKAPALPHLTLPPLYAYLVSSTRYGDGFIYGRKSIHWFNSAWEVRGKWRSEKRGQMRRDMAQHSSHVQSSHLRPAPSSSPSSRPSAVSPFFSNVPHGYPDHTINLTHVYSPISRLLSPGPLSHLSPLSYSSPVQPLATLAFLSLVSPLARSSCASPLWLGCVYDANEPARGRPCQWLASADRQRGSGPLSK